MNNQFIYAICDPNGVKRYIGKTQYPGRRFEEHLKNLKGFTVCTMEILEHVRYDADANEAERRWIKKIGRENLINRTNGGNGAWAHPISDSTRKKLSESIRRGLNMPGVQEGAAPKRSAYMKRMWTDPIWRADRLKKLRKAFVSPERIEKLKAARRKLFSDPVKKAEMIGKMMSGRRRPGVTEKIAEKLRILYANPEMREKIIKIGAPWKWKSGMKGGFKRVSE